MKNGDMVRGRFGEGLDLSITGFSANLGRTGCTQGATQLGRSWCDIDSLHHDPCCMNTLASENRVSWCRNNKSE
jgi:hypothetical protein